MNKNEVTLTAFNAKTVERNCPMLNAVIRKTPAQNFMAFGEDAYGNKLYVILEPSRVKEVVDAGLARLDGVTMEEVIKSKD